MVLVSMISRKTKNKDHKQSLMNTAFDVDLDLKCPSAERCEQVYRSYLEARNQAKRGSAATGYQVYLVDRSLLRYWFYCWCNYHHATSLERHPKAFMMCMGDCCRHRSEQYWDCTARVGWVMWGLLDVLYDLYLLRMSLIYHLLVMCLYLRHSCDTNRKRHLAVKLSALY